LETGRRAPIDGRCHLIIAVDIAIFRTGHRKEIVRRMARFVIYVGSGTTGPPSVDRPEVRRTEILQSVN
jgi:hypothetical protein